MLWNEIFLKFRGQLDHFEEIEDEILFIFTAQFQFLSTEKLDRICAGKQKPKFSIVKSKLEGELAEIHWNSKF